MCRRLSDDTDALRSSPQLRSLADSIVDRVRGGAAPDLLADDLDELEDLLLQAGHAAGLSPVRSYEGLLGSGDGHRVLEVLTCPGGTCGRIEPPGPAPRTCPVHRAPLGRTRLRS